MTSYSVFGNPSVSRISHAAKKISFSDLTENKYRMLKVSAT